MSYNIEKRIESRRKELGLMKKDIYEKLEMTGTGYYQMLERNTISVKNLTRLSEILNVNINYFFVEEEGSSMYKNKSLDSTKNNSDLEEQLKAQIELLKSQLAETNRNNEFLRKMMEGTLQQVNGSLREMSELLGKEPGAEAKCLPLAPDELVHEIKMRA